jgi:hypothetical protein
MSELDTLWGELEKELNSEKQDKQPKEALQEEPPKEDEASEQTSDKLLEVLGEDVYEEKEEDPYLQYEINLKTNLNAVEEKKQVVLQEGNELSQQLQSYTDKKYYKDEKPFYLLPRDSVKQMANELIENNGVSPIEAGELLRQYDEIHLRVKQHQEKLTAVEQESEQLTQQGVSLLWDKAGAYLLKELPQIKQHELEIRNLILNDMQHKTQKEINAMSYEDVVNAMKNAVKKSSFVKEAIKARKAQQQGTQDTQVQPPDVTANNSKATSSGKITAESAYKKVKGMSQKEFNKLTSVEEMELFSALMTPYL